MKNLNKKIVSILTREGALSSRQIGRMLNKGKGKKIKSRAKFKAISQLLQRKKIFEQKDGKFYVPDRNKLKNSRIYTPKVEFEKLCRKYKYDLKFPRNVEQEVRQIRVKNPIDKGNRTDFRNDMVITIDGEDAKDLDDAVFVSKEKTKYKLYVHIADVSFYVRESTSVDREAKKRGNSVYLVDKVLPMLPAALSNDLCSLNRNTDKYTMSAIIDIDFDGSIIDYSFASSIINVKRRFSYKEVERVIRACETELSTENVDDAPSDKEFHPYLKLMEELALVLKKKRIQDGSIDFDLPELKIECDENSYPIKIEKTQPLFAYSIIEEFMLAANRVVATYLSEKGDSIYRVHEQPLQEKVQSLNAFINKFGISLANPEDPHPKDFQTVCSAIADKPEARLLNTILLRSLPQAYYAMENKGHFGLGFNKYTHFTSPIRRYPDLIVHRLLKYYLEIDTKVKNIRNKTHLMKVAQWSSATERQAMEAEREFVKKKSAMFMQNKIGEVYDGYISAVKNFGFFVEIEPYGVEGLCKLNYLDKTYFFDEENYQYVDHSGKKVLQIGDKIQVKLVKVDIRRVFIDFELVLDK